MLLAHRLACLTPRLHINSLSSQQLTSSFTPVQLPLSQQRKSIRLLKRASTVAMAGPAGEVRNPEATKAAPKIDFSSKATLQKARTWDEGMESKFATTPLSEIFKGKKVVIFGLPGAFTGVCSKAHVPSYLRNVDTFKEKGVDRVICVSVNDPYVLHGWAKALNAEDKIEFYGDFDGSFHRSLGLTLDLTEALLGPRSQRWSAYVVDGDIKALNVEKVPSEFEVSSGDYILKFIE